MTKTSVRRAVVIVLCILLAQSFVCGQTVNTPAPLPVLKLRVSFEVQKPRQFTFSRVSKLLAVQREDGSVQIVDLTDGHEQAVLPIADKALYSMHWTSDGLRLLIINSKSATLWDARAGTRLSTPIEIKRDKYFILFEHVTLSPDEKFLLNVKKDESIKALALDRQKTTAQVWSLETGQLKFEIKVKGECSQAKLSPNGKQILTTSEKEDLKLWDVETGRLFANLQTPERAIFREGSTAEFTPDGRFIIQTHETGTYIWHSSGALNVHIPFNKDSSDSRLQGFTDDGKMFATVQQTRGWHWFTSIEFRECETGELKFKLNAPKWEDWPDQMLWSSNGRTLVAASGTGKYEGRIWDIRSERFKAAFPMLRTFSRWPMTFGFKDRDALAIHPTLPIVSAASNKFLRLWSAETGELLQTIDNDGGYGAWSADGELFLTFGKDLKSAQVWDVMGSDAQSKAR